MSTLSLNNVNVVFNGWSKSDSYFDLKNSEDAVRKGKNYYFSSLLQIFQTIVVSDLALQLAELHLNGQSSNLLKIVSTVIPLTSLVVCPFFAAVKMGKIEKLQKYPKIIRPINFLAEHTGNFLKVAFVVETIALIVFGSYFLAAGIVLSSVYHIIDQKGYVPRKISLFMEHYMPVISSVGTLLSGQASLLMSVVIIFRIAQKVSFFVNKYFSFLGDSILVKTYNKISGSHIPTLAECDVPFLRQKELSYKQIVEILDKSNDRYKLNPSHFIHSVLSSENFSEDKNFDEFLTLFDFLTLNYSVVSRKLIDNDRFIDFLSKEFPGVNKESLKKDGLNYIEELAKKNNKSKEDFLVQDVRSKKEFSASFDSFTLNYSVVSKKLIDDERFMDFLSKKFPDVNKESLKKEIHEYIERLAKYNNQTKEAFLVEYIRGNLKKLVKKLKGSIGSRAKGSQIDFDKAIQEAPFILSYLKKMKALGNTIELEDNLLKFSIEAGSYCALGVSRAVSEISLSIQQTALCDSFKDWDYFEVRMYGMLQQERKILMDSFYHGSFKRIYPAWMAQDVHIIKETFKKYVEPGFYPLTQLERMEFSERNWLTELIYLPARKRLYQEYIKVIDSNLLVSEQECVEYITRCINNNPELTKEEKEALLDRWADLDQHEKFKRLMFVMLGVLIPV